MQKLMNEDLRVLLEPILDDCAPVFWPFKIAKEYYQLPEVAKAMRLSNSVKNWWAQIDYTFAEERNLSSTDLLYLMNADFNVTYFGGCIRHLLEPDLWYKVVLARFWDYPKAVIHNFEKQFGLPNAESNHKAWVVVDQYRNIVHYDALDSAVNLYLQDTGFTVTIQAENWWVLKSAEETFHVYAVPAEFLNLHTGHEAAKRATQQSIKELATTFITNTAQDYPKWSERPSTQRNPPISFKHLPLLAMWIQDPSQPLHYLSDGHWKKASNTTLGTLANQEPENFHLGADLPYLHKVNGTAIKAGVHIETALRHREESKVLFELQIDNLTLKAKPVLDIEEVIEKAPQGKLFLTEQDALKFGEKLFEVSQP